MTPANDTIIYLPPEALLADDKARNGLIKPRIERLAQSIMEHGEVLTPIDAERFEGKDGVRARITDGHYRHAAVVKLNKEHNAGITIPVRLHPPQDPIARMKRQVSFNAERQDLSPIDVGVAAKKLLEAGVARIEIRSIFKRATGKGGKAAPASNAYINMMMSFLEFPRDIRDKVHNGIIGVQAAYQLTKTPRDKWEEIIARCEREREAEIAADEAAESKFLEGIKKEEEAAAKLKALETETETAKAKFNEASKAVDEKARAEGDALAVYRTAKAAEEKKAAEEQYRVARDAAKEVMSTAEAAKKEAEKLEAKLVNLKERIAERAAKLADARKAPKKEEPVKKPVNAAQVAKAAKAAGVTNFVRLKAPEMQKAVDEWSLPGSFPMVQKIAIIINRCFAGELTPNQAYDEMGKVTGEKQPRVVKKAREA